jgi:hypothetical protein
MKNYYEKSLFSILMNNEYISTDNLITAKNLIEVILKERSSKTELNKMEEKVYEEEKISNK